MVMTYEPESDVAYIWLVNDPAAGAATDTVVCDLDEQPYTLNVDFDSDGHILGIEILEARARLPEVLLSKLVEDQGEQTEASILERRLRLRGF